jgi:hypothetical protein
MEMDNSAPLTYPFSMFRSVIKLFLAMTLALSPLVALAHGMAQDGKPFGQHHRMVMSAMDHAQAGHARPHEDKAAADDPARLAACASVCLLLASIALPAQPAALPSPPVQRHERASVLLPSPTGTAPPLQPPRPLSA